MESLWGRGQGLVWGCCGGKTFGELRGGLASKYPALKKKKMEEKEKKITEQAKPNMCCASFATDGFNSPKVKKKNKNVLFL